MTLTPRLAMISGWCAVALVFFLPISTSLTHILLILTVLCYLCSGQFSQNWRWIRNHPITWSSLGFFGLLILGLTYTTAPWPEALHILSKYSKFCFIPLLLPIFADSRWQKPAIYAFIAAALLTLVLCYLKAAGIVIYNPADPDPSSIFKDHIQTSFILAFAAFLLAVEARDQCRLLAKISYWLCFSLFALYLVFLNTGRSGQVMFSLLMLFFIYRSLGWRSVLIGLSSIVFIWLAAFFISPTFHHLVQTSITQVQQYQAKDTEQVNTTSIGLRLTFQHTTWQLIQQHPWLGSGTGSFATEYAKLAKKQQLPLTTNPHSEYLMVASQLGLVGLLALVLVFLWQWRHSKDLPTKYALMAQGMLLMIAIGCLGNSWLLDTTEGHFFVFFTALLYANLPNYYQPLRSTL